MQSLFNAREEFRVAFASHPLYHLLGAFMGSVRAGMDMLIFSVQMDGKTKSMKRKMRDDEIVFYNFFFSFLVSINFQLIFTMKQFWATECPTAMAVEAAPKRTHTIGAASNW